MNSAYVESLLKDNAVIKKELEEVPQAVKDKTMTNTDALSRVKCLDALSKVITTNIHLDGIKQAIKRNDDAIKQPTPVFETRGTGRYEKVRR